MTLTFHCKFIFKSISCGKHTLRNRSIEFMVLNSQVGREFPEFWHVLIVFQLQNGWVGFLSIMYIPSINFLCNLMNSLHPWH